MSAQSISWQNPALPGRIPESVRNSVPLAIEQIDVVLRLLSAACGERIGSFLDVGSGDGVLAAAILNEYPYARAVVIDGSEPLMAHARAQLHPFEERVRFVHADCHQEGWATVLGKEHPFAAIVAGGNAQPVSNARQRALFTEIFQLLKPEGAFINIEYVASATRWTESVWDDYLIDAIFGRELKAAPGKSRAEVARDYFARAAEDASILAPLEVQCDWLREIGYDNVDCFLKVQELAIFGGQKPAA